MQKAARSYWPSSSIGPQRDQVNFESHSPLARRSRPQRTKKQSDPNRRAFADLALDCHPAPVGLGDASADRQTQTGAARAGGSSCIDPVEPLEIVGEIQDEYDEYDVEQHPAAELTETGGGPRRRAHDHPRR